MRRIFYVRRSGFGLGFHVRIVETEIVLRGFITLSRGPQKPFYRLGVVLLDTATGLITKSQITLRGGQLLLGSGQIPFGGFAIILLDHLAGFVKDPEVELGRRITSLGRFPIPFDGVGIILRDALAGFTNEETRQLVALLSRLITNLDRLGSAETICADG